MFRSKSLKDRKEKKRSKFYQWWIESKLVDWLHDFTWKYYRQPFSRIKKMYGWYVNVFRHDYDFDGHCLFAIIEYKLKRLEKVLLVGHSIQENEDMKALRVAIKLAGRLKDDKYEEAFWSRHNRKWGELKSWFEPVNDGSGSSYWHSSRPNAVTDEQKQLERADRLAEIHAADSQTKREERWLYAILHKYLRNWWD